MLLSGRSLIRCTRSRSSGIKGRAHLSVQPLSDAPEGAPSKPLNVSESSAWGQHAASIRSGRALNALDLLRQRGLIKDIAGSEDHLWAKLTDRRVAIYSGIDPTASSLHLGHLIPLNVLIWLYACGHHVCSLVGDATALIGDPTDRLDARAEVEDGEKQARAVAIKAQLKTIWRNVDTILADRQQAPPPDQLGFREDLGPRRQIEGNQLWLGKLRLLDFLDTVGHCAKVGTMLSRDSVKMRLDSGKSMSLAEFTYPSLQAYDWFHLFVERSMEIQVGGSDQYGNIVAGLDLIKHMQKARPARCSPSNDGKRIVDKAPFGITTPLLTSSEGKKFGKSAGNAVWLDRNMTKPFDLYGHLLRTSDDDIERYLLLLTTVPSTTIASVMAEFRNDPGKRAAQHLLAYEVCRLAHGDESAAHTRDEHNNSRAPTVRILPDPDRTVLPRDLVRTASLWALLTRIGMATSNGRAKAIITSGALYAARETGETGELEYEKVEAGETTLDLDRWLVQGRYLFLRYGKWRTFGVEVVDEQELADRGLAGEVAEKPKRVRGRSLRRALLRGKISSATS